MPHSDALKIFSCKKYCEKRRNSCNKLFLLFSQCYLPYMTLISYFKCTLKVALQTLGRKFYKNTKRSSLYSQSLLIFIHRTPVDERHPITREIRDLLRPRSTQTGNTVYLYMSSSFIYILKIHRQSFKHSIR